MAFDCSSMTAAPLPKDQAARFKFRIRFRKTDLLRFVSHHDLMHIIERLLRRANLNVAQSQGFNPHPRIWFAAPLALGIVGLNEVLELELLDALPADELKQRIQAQCPPGLDIVSVRLIDLRTSARVRRAMYVLPLPAEEPDLPARCAEFLMLKESWFERKRPQPRRINLRPFVDEVQVEDSRLKLALWITPHGAARPDEIAAALHLSHLLEDGVVIERTDLELFDELPPGAEGPHFSAAIMPAISNDTPRSLASHPTPMIGTPLSFDS